MMPPVGQNIPPPPPNMALAQQFAQGAGGAPPPGMGAPPMGGGGMMPPPGPPGMGMPQPSIDPALLHGAVARMMSKPVNKASSAKKKTKIPPKVTRSNGKSERLNV